MRPLVVIAGRDAELYRRWFWGSSRNSKALGTYTPSVARDTMHQLFHRQLAVGHQIGFDGLALFFVRDADDR